MKRHHTPPSFSFVPRVPLSILLLLSFLGAPLAAAQGAGTPVAEAVRWLERTAGERELWPGFDPRKIPLAVFDGERTWLFQHPSPPPEFHPGGAGGSHFQEGRHPQVTANSSVELGGVWTATVLLRGTEDLAPGRLAGLMAHEAFHVFQRQAYPDWGANEVDLFSYPTDDVEGIVARRLETEALRRALLAEDTRGAACWATAALDIRRRRFAALPDFAARYERATELYEGLSQYIQYRVSGQPPTGLLARPFAVDAIRDRGYAVGQTMAWLLDRLARRWQKSIARGKVSSLDEALSAALTAVGGTLPCSFPETEPQRRRSAAAAEVAELVQRRQELRQELLGRDGWRVEVRAPAASPLSPAGFDPLNVRLVAPGQVLHGRFLRLAGAGAEIELLGRDGLTEAAGVHPLFDGVRSLVVTGFAERPEVTTAESGAVTVTAEGFQATAPAVRLVEEERRVVLELGVVE